MSMTNQRTAGLISEKKRDEKIGRAQSWAAVWRVDTDVRAIDAAVAIRENLINFERLNDVAAVVEWKVPSALVL